MASLSDKVAIQFSSRAGGDLARMEAMDSR
jgi:hypothetical protein